MLRIQTRCCSSKCLSLDKNIRTLVQSQKITATVISLLQQVGTSMDEFRRVGPPLNKRSELTPGTKKSIRIQLDRVYTCNIQCESERIRNMAKRTRKA